MKRKDYQKPTTKVVQLKRPQLLLTGSVGATMNDEWEEETI